MVQNGQVYVGTRVSNTHHLSMTQPQQHWLWPNMDDPSDGRVESVIHACDWWRDALQNFNSALGTTAKSETGKQKESCGLIKVIPSTYIGGGMEIPWR